MKYRFAFFLALLVGALAAVAEDKLVSYDAATSIIVVERSGQLKSYRIKPFTEFTINGTKAPLDQLIPGLAVSISLADMQTVSRIAVRVAQAPKSTGRSIVLKMRLDGHDTVRVRDGQLTIEHRGDRTPEEIFVNGNKWVPLWNGKNTEPYKAFDPPLVAFTQNKPVLKQISGRSKVVMEKWSPGDFEKILTLLFDDTAGGDDLYEIQVTW